MAYTAAENAIDAELPSGTDVATTLVAANGCGLTNKVVVAEADDDPDALTALMTNE